MNQDTLVLKFGGAAVASPEQFAKIAEIIIQRKEEFSRLVVVVSAMGETTNQLIELAKKVHPQPPQREYDMLISTGERVSMALLAMALWRFNCEALSFTGSQSGIITCDRHTEARIIDVRPYRLLDCLGQGKVVIVAGFQGVSRLKEITTLGRGGSDTSAVALAAALGASKVEFFKDVPGFFDEDPKKNANAIQYLHLNYDHALNIVLRGAKILHERAIRLAAKNGLPLHIRSFLSYHDNPGTLIYEANKARESSPSYEEP